MQDSVTIEDINANQEQIDLVAAKQLLAELLMVKNQINGSRTVITSILIVQLKGFLKSRLKDYQDQGFFLGESINLKLSDKTKLAKVDFLFSPNLLQLINKVKEELKNEDANSQAQFLESVHS